MRKPIDNTVHPMSQVRGGRIDIFFNGSQYRSTQDMMLMLEQSVPGLEKDDHILLINSLSVHKVLASAADKLSKGHQGKILVYTAACTMLREKLDFLSKLIAAKQIKMIVLNSWEFAAAGSRQKHALAQWLREMRDAHEVRIVVYSMEDKMPDVGALSMLGWTANSCDEVGEWHWHNKYVNDQFYPNATGTIDEYMAGVEARGQRLEAVAGEPTAVKATEVAVAAPVAPAAGGMTMPRKQRNILNFVGPQEMAERLKNKELSGVGAQGTLAIAA